jgi:hypothetical protein
MFPLKYQIQDWVMAANASSKQARRTRTREFKLVPHAPVRGTVAQVARTWDTRTAGALVLLFEVRASQN